jgi:methylmalonyl-CoA/ethylmalonyl-CoA epimerase
MNGVRNAGATMMTEQAASAGVGVRRLGQISVNAADVERARSFYRDVLELKHLFDASGMSFFDCGGVRLMISRPESAELAHTSVLYLDVADIAGAHRVLTERGVIFERGPHKLADMGTYELWMAFFRDSENNLLAFMSEVPKT